MALDSGDTDAIPVSPFRPHFPPGEWMVVSPEWARVHPVAHVPGVVVEQYSQFQGHRSSVPRHDTIQWPFDRYSTMRP